MAGKKKGASRDREQTREKLLAAARELVIEHGFETLGVNAIARRAGVDKVLLYRYFGGLSGLLIELSPRIQNHVTRAKRKAVEPEPGAEVVPLAPASREELEAHLCKALDEMIDGLRKDRLELELQRWLLAEQNPLTDAISEALEESGAELMALFAHWEPPEGVDLTLLSSVLSSGVTFLVLRAQTFPYYLGNDMTEDASWERLRQTLHGLVRMVVMQLKKKSTEGEQDR